MISGIVTNRHATVTLTFLLSNGSSIPIEFVIDTGFTGELCLPLEAVSLMGLTFRHDTPANLADNSEVLLFTKRSLFGMVKSEKSLSLRQEGDLYWELPCWMSKNLLFSLQKVGW